MIRRHPKTARDKTGRWKSLSGTGKGTPRQDQYTDIMLGKKPVECNWHFSPFNKKKVGIFAHGPAMPFRPGAYALLPTSGGCNWALLPIVSDTRLLLKRI
jgi:hypothetical protein